MKTLILSSAIAALCGCATVSPQQKAAHKAKLDEFFSTIPKCSDNCEPMWSAAQIWVSNNSRYRIQIATDTIIETFSGRAGGYAARVTKAPVGSGEYEIQIKLVCTNQSVLVQCNPMAVDAGLDFNRAVTAAGAL